jgi:hypothetical protein
MQPIWVAFGVTILLGGLFSPVAAEAQQAAKIARMGYLAGSLAASPSCQRPSVDLERSWRESRDWVPGADNT